MSPFSSNNKPSYESLPETEESLNSVDEERQESHGLLNNTTPYEKAEQTQNRSASSSSSWICHRFISKKHSTRFLFFSHIIVSCIYILILYVSNQATSSPEYYARKFSTWSPALPSIKFKPPTFFHGEIVQTNPFRGPLGERPPPSVDEAWQQLGVGVPGIRLSGEEVEGYLGKKIVNGTRAMHEVQDGKGGYVAMLEVMHLLHCLDEVRKALFFNWDYYKDTYNTNDTTTIQTHHDHCIDAIRTSLMCTADVTPVTFYDDSSIPERRLSLPDFSSKHMCRDFDAILAWSWETERAVMWEDVGDAVTWDPKLGGQGGHEHGGTGGGHRHGGD